MVFQRTYPRNPICGKNNRPRARGQTRINNGKLEYKNPMSGLWDPAVHLQDIRADVLRRAPHSHYTFKKTHGNSHGQEPTNYTAFLLKDKDVGSERANRPDILFTISNDRPHSKMPDDYVVDNGRVVLDAFDHGIRDFPELPLVLSSELDGSDIEYYYRQNAEIADYDLVARMPNGYRTGKHGEKQRHEPPRVGTINQRAQRFRTRAGCVAWCKREGTRSKNDAILSILPADYRDVNSTKGFRDLTKAEIQVVEKKNRGTMPSRARSKKALRDVSQEDDSDDGGTTVKGNGSEAEDETALAFFGSTHERVYTTRTGPHPRCSVKTLPSQASPNPFLRSRANLRNMPSTRMNLRSKEPAHHEAFTVGDDNGSTSVEKPSYNTMDNTTMAQPPGTESTGPSTVPQLSSSFNEAAESLATGRKRRHQIDKVNTSEDEDHAVRYETQINRRREEANYYSVGRHCRMLNISPQDLSQRALRNHTAWMLADFRRRHQQSRRPFEPGIDKAFQQETEDGVLGGDFRYMAPQDHGGREDDILAINRALELTRIQFCKLKGMCVPSDFSEYRSESYACQWRRIQDKFDFVWIGAHTPFSLYRLPKWRHGFGNWRVLSSDALGRSLMEELEEGERALADMEKEFREQDRLEAEEKARKKATRERGKA